MNEEEKFDTGLKKFREDICKTVGHEWFKDPNEFADICTRCQERHPWAGSLSKIAASMTAPLKRNLEYKAMGKLIATENIEQSDLPVFDKDLPPSPKLVEDVCRVVGHEFEKLDALVVKCKRCNHATISR